MAHGKRSACGSGYRMCIYRSVCSDILSRFVVPYAFSYRAAARDL